MSTLAVNTITNAAGGNTAQINGMTPTADSLQGFRNRIINGDMRIDQRNAGASVTPTTSGTYTLDRWRADLSQASKFSVQQNAGGVTPPAGFSNYLGATSLSAYTVGASEQFTLRHFIEGFNSADLGWGTSGAQSVTLSFWVRSSLTGTFGGTIVNSAQDRCYGFSFTVSAANTWEQKTIAIDGDTTGTWLTNNGIGIAVRFSLGSGPSSVSAAGSWGGSAFTGVTGQVNLVATNGATFYITGVQLEAGSVATPFERRPYGTELALCQRYYYEGVSAAGVGQSAIAINCYIVLPVEMRATPSVNKTAGNFVFGDLVSAGFASSSTPVLQDVLLTSLNKLYRAQVGGFSGLTTYRTYAHELKTNTAAFTLSAEL